MKHRIALAAACALGAIGRRLPADVEGPGEQRVPLLARDAGERVDGVEQQSQVGRGVAARVLAVALDRREPRHGGVLETVKPDERVVGGQLGVGQDERAGELVERGDELVEGVLGEQVEVGVEVVARGRHGASCSDG